MYSPNSPNRTCIEQELDRSKMSNKGDDISGPMVTLEIIEWFYYKNPGSAVSAEQNKLILRFMNGCSKDICSHHMQNNPSVFTQPLQFSQLNELLCDTKHEERKSQVLPQCWSVINSMVCSLCPESSIYELQYFERGDDLVNVLFIFG